MYQREQVHGKDKLHYILLLLYVISFKTGSDLKDMNSPEGNFLKFLFYFVYKVRLQTNLNFKYSIIFLLNDCSYLCQVNAPIQGEAILTALQAGLLMKNRVNSSYME